MRIMPTAVVVGSIDAGNVWARHHLHAPATAAAACGAHVTACEWRSAIFCCQQFSSIGTFRCSCFVRISCFCAFTATLSKVQHPTFWSWNIVCQQSATVNANGYRALFNGPFCSWILLCSGPFNKGCSQSTLHPHVTCHVLRQKHAFSNGC